MYDSITFKIDTIRHQEAIVWRENADNIRRIDEHSYIGNIGNLKIQENMNGIKATGSIAKFLNGENMTTLSKQKCKDALKKIEIETGWNLQDAVLTRVDIGKSIITEKPVNNYLSLFGFAGRKHKSIDYTNNELSTVTFSTKTGWYSICAYDKTKEMEASKQEIPTLFKGENVIRIEGRILKRQGIKAKLGHGIDINPMQLIDNEIYETAKKFLISFYASIEKIGRTVFLDAKKEYTPKEITEIFAEAERQTNPESILLIQNLRQNGKISDRNLISLKQKMRKNSRNYQFSNTNELIIELDEKMHYRG